MSEIILHNEQAKLENREYERQPPREKKRCGAKTRQKGTPCKRWARANGRCNLHGGKSLAGPASPTFKNGRWSKYIPNRLMDRYHESLQDETLLDLRNEIALVDAQIAEVLENVDDISDVQWRDIVTYWVEFMEAIKDGDNDRQIELVYRLDDVIDAGTNYRGNIDKVNRLIDRRSRLVEKEIKNQATSQQMLALDIVITLLAQIVMAAKEAALQHAEPDVAKQIIMATNESFKRIVGPAKRN